MPRSTRSFPFWRVSSTKRTLGWLVAAHSSPRNPRRSGANLGQGMTHVKRQFAHLLNPRLFALVLAPVACRWRQRHAASAMRFGLTAVSTACQAHDWLLIGRGSPCRKDRKRRADHRMNSRPKPGGRDSISEIPGATTTTSDGWEPPGDTAGRPRVTAKRAESANPRRTSHVATAIAASL